MNETKSRYFIDRTWKGYYGEDIHFNGYIELDEKVINSVNDDWRETFYQLITPQQIADHIAFNMIVNDLKLSQMDGFADHNDNEVVLL